MAKTIGEGESAQAKGYEILFYGTCHVNAIRNSKSAMKKHSDLEKKGSGLKFININQPHNRSMYLDHHGLPSDVAFQRFKPEVLVSMTNRCTYFGVGLFEYEEPFDFHLPGSALPIDPSRRIIPYSQVFDSMRLRIYRSLEPLNRLRERFDGPMVNILLQPPLKDGQIYLDRLRGKRSLLTGQRVTPAAIRLKIYRLQNQITQEASNKINVPTLGAPAEALDKEGYLKPKFAKDQPVHVTAAYGELQFAQIMSWIDGERTPLPQ